MCTVFQAEFLEADSQLKGRHKDKCVAFRADLDQILLDRAERERAEEQQTQARNKERELFLQTKKVIV